MSYNLPFAKQTLVIGALAEGSSIRSIKRLTGVHRDTIMRLGVRVSHACGQLLDERMRGLNCNRIQLDEIWGFIAKKQRNVAPEEMSQEVGDVWTYVTVDPDSKIVPAYHVQKRDYDHTHRFISDLAARMNNRIQLSSDSMSSYMSVVEDTFGPDVDYDQILTVYSAPEHAEERRYSPRMSVLSGAPLSVARRTSATSAPRTWNVRI